MLTAINNAMVINKKVSKTWKPFVSEFIFVSLKFLGIAFVSASIIS